MAALATVEDLEVVEDRVRQLDPRPPSFPVEQLDLHPRLQNDSIQWRRHDGEELGSTEVRTPLSLHQGSSLTASRDRDSNPEPCGQQIAAPCSEIEARIR